MLGEDNFFCTTTFVMVKIPDFLALNMSIVSLESSSLKTIDNFYIYKSSMYEHTPVQSNETDSLICNNKSFEYISKASFFSFVYISNAFFNVFSFNNFSLKYVFQRFLPVSSSMLDLEDTYQFYITSILIYQTNKMNDGEYEMNNNSNNNINFNDPNNNSADSNTINIGEITMSDNNNNDNLQQNNFLQLAVETDLNENSYLTDQSDVVTENKIIELTKAKYPNAKIKHISHRKE